ncbi:hypothetical protein [Cellulomonas sp. S1-8]|uniref:hypothetical protein n=1 Tax=Cellulomonas sp. S1-8 TaxID=2904790 RepID=UPI002244D49D|nr:hypothetical protein [Cellulomonas sp. S1-8]UZN02151.1 hypothetical protein OKX07_13780 [Cellulomonas sp. S1-8]
MSTGGNLRRAVRTSGVVACGATVLFLVAGTSYLMRVDTPPQMWEQTWAAGEPITLDDRPEVILWAPDLAGSAQDVTCTLSDARSYDGVLPAGPDESRAALATVTVDGEDLTYLARIDHIRSGTIVCDGGGLTQVRVSDDLRPGLERGSATAFFIGAAVAALWAFVTLRSTRPRR